MKKLISNHKLKHKREVISRKIIHQSKVKNIQAMRKIGLGGLIGAGVGSAVGTFTMGGFGTIAGIWSGGMIGAGIAHQKILNRQDTKKTKNKRCKI